MQPFIGRVPNLYYTSLESAEGNFKPAVARARGAAH